jgi:hypothetical protein
MAELGLPSSEFAKRLSDSHALNSSLQELIERLASSRDAPQMLPLLKNLEPGLETHTLKLLRYLVALLSLRLGNALDVEHVLLCATVKISRQNCTYHIRIDKTVDRPACFSF